MLQNLLAERFKLTLHHETKELPVYELIVAKGGLKLKESENIRRLPNGEVAQMLGGGLRDGQQRITGTASMALLASVLQSQLGTFVKDETGLTGVYDFQVEYVSGVGDAAGQGSTLLLSSALGDLGLKLQKTTSPIDVLAVDNNEKQPTEN
jgi:uncharacterized protein (TIGR03435 family)